MFGMNGWCKPDGDLISRAAAIDELNKGAWGVEWDKTLAKTMIESLPSAQPTQNTRVNSNNALDTISRQAAIDAIKEDKIDLTNPNVRAVFKSTGDFEKVETQVMTCDRHIKILKDLPPAQPERILARWEKQVLGWKCSNCTLCTGDFGAREFSFCPNCGAKMEGLEVNE